MTISVVIPAHNEATVIARCLGALLEGARPGELDVVVVCNGCRDATADAARRFGDRVRVVETAVPSKTNALNLGDDAVRGFPRLYIDADVVLPIDAVRRIAKVLDGSGPPAAAPTMQMDLASASWGVRAFYAVWTRLPYVAEGMIGVGTFAVSEAGRARFGRFPDVIGDDAYVRMHFDATERVRVDDAVVRVVAPATIADLIKIMTRSRLGDYELAERYPDLVARARRGKSYGAAGKVVALRPWLWPHAAVYLYVNLVSRRRARAAQASRAAYVWERDESSRR